MTQTSLRPAALRAPGASGPRISPAWPAMDRAAFERMATRRVEVPRLIAMLMLVSYHVVGSGPHAGLGLDYPHGLRILADALTDVRMPLFAFVAGLIYAVRPVRPGERIRFLGGKARRLLVPGAVAATLFFGVAMAMGSRFGGGWEDLWRIYLFPYAHYWFLQSIFLVFALFALLDVATGGRAAVPVGLVAAGLCLAGAALEPNLFSVNQAIYLAPYFAAGVLWWRHGHRLHARPGALLLAALACLLAAILWTMGLADAQGRIPPAKGDGQSLMLGLSACAALMALPIAPRGLRALGAASFTIYLYHVFGTAGMREALHALGVSSVPAHLALGLAAGLAFPVALHLAAVRWGAARALLLGLR